MQAFRLGARIFGYGWEGGCAGSKMRSRLLKSLSSREQPGLTSTPHLCALHERLKHRLHFKSPPTAEQKLHWFFALLFVMEESPLPAGVDTLSWPLGALAAIRLHLVRSTATKIAPRLDLREWREAR